MIQYIVLALADCIYSKRKSEGDRKEKDKDNLFHRSPTWSSTGVTQEDTSGMCTYFTFNDSHLNVKNTDSTRNTVIQTEYGT